MMLDTKQLKYVTFLVVILVGKLKFRSIMSCLYSFYLNTSQSVGVILGKFPVPVVYNESLSHWISEYVEVK